MTTPDVIARAEQIVADTYATVLNSQTLVEEARTIMAQSRASHECRVPGQDASARPQPDSWVGFGK